MWGNIARHSEFRSHGQSSHGVILTTSNCNCDPILKMSLAYFRCLVMLLPNSVTPDLIASGRMFTWWGVLEEGKVAKFDLSWFKFLARYEKMKWCKALQRSLGDSPSSVGSGGMAPAVDQHSSGGLQHLSYTGLNAEFLDDELEQRCDAVLEQNEGLLTSKFLRCMSLPFESPTAGALADAANHGRLDAGFGRYKIPTEIDSVMGTTTTWKFVSRWIVYSLEGDPFLENTPREHEQHEQSQPTEAGAQYAYSLFGRDKNYMEGGASSSSAAAGGSSRSGPSSSAPTQKIPRSFHWKRLEFLIRRMRPHVQKPGAAYGWHVVTVLINVAISYHQRAVRERQILKANGISLTEARNNNSRAGAGVHRVGGGEEASSVFLTTEADTMFCWLLMPLLHTLGHHKDGMAQQGAMECVVRLLRLTNPDLIGLTEEERDFANTVGARSPGLGASGGLGNPRAFPLHIDPFDTVYGICEDALETLSDPEASSRAGKTFRLASRFVPAIVRYRPELLPNFLSTVLDGIDPSDSAKTLAATTLVVTVFSYIPAIDLNDLPMSTRSSSSSSGDEQTGTKALEDAFPGIMLQQIESTARTKNNPTSTVTTAAATIPTPLSSPDKFRTAALTASTSLPGFVTELFEKTLDYVRDASLDSGGANKSQGKAIMPGQTMDNLNASMFSVMTLIVLSQCSPGVFRQAISRFADLLNGNLLLEGEKVKLVKGIGNALVRVSPAQALEEFLPLIEGRVKKVGEQDGAQVAYWLDITSGLIRYEDCVEWSPARAVVLTSCSSCHVAHQHLLVGASMHHILVSRTL